MGGFAWVTLATNDSYSLGALVLGHSLRRAGTSHDLVALITPGVSAAMRNQLSTVFSVVQEVNVLDSKDEANLALLDRPELGITFTKLHCWRLTQYEKCVFLDADTLVLKNSDELFEREELSAAPDPGWPDCFNSGVFVYRPSIDTFNAIIKFALSKGSFDGGDQGLLNLFFSDWATKDISKHLPFIYNMVSTATYSYLPAYKQFGGDAKIVHFIGGNKPWLQYFDSETRLVRPPSGSEHLQQLIQLWWDIFCSTVHPSLSSEMLGLAGALAQLTLGAPRSAEQTAFEEHMRKQAWEQGTMDYMGRDSFDNIWRRISQTLAEAPIKSVAPPKEEETPTKEEAPTTPEESSKTSTEVPPTKSTKEPKLPDPNFPEPLVQLTTDAAHTPGKESPEVKHSAPALQPTQVTEPSSESTLQKSSVSPPTPPTVDLPLPPPIPEQAKIHEIQSAEIESSQVAVSPSEQKCTKAAPIVMTPKVPGTPSVTEATPPTSPPVIIPSTVQVSDIQALKIEESVLETPPIGNLPSELAPEKQEFKDNSLVQAEIKDVDTEMKIEKQDQKEQSLNVSSPEGTAETLPTVAEEIKVKEKETTSATDLKQISSLTEKVLSTTAPLSEISQSPLASEALSSQTLPGVPKSAATVSEVPQPAPIVPEVPQPAPVVPKVPQPAPGVPQPAPVVPEVPQPAPVVPEVPQPAAVVPEVPQPAAVVPEVPQPASIMPEVPQPDSVVPEVPQPAPVVQEVPQSAPVIPEVPQPASVVPEVPQPASVVPEVPQPALVVPEVLQPALVVPEVPQPASVVPEAPQPASVVPEVPQPALVVPEVSQPTPVTPEVSKTPLVAPEVSKTPLVAPEIAKASSIVTEVPKTPSEVPPPPPMTAGVPSSPLVAPGIPHTPVGVSELLQGPAAKVPSLSKDTPAAAPAIPPSQSIPSAQASAVPDSETPRLPQELSKTPVTKTAPEETKTASCTAKSVQDTKTKPDESEKLKSKESGGTSLTQEAPPSDQAPIPPKRRGHKGAAATSTPEQGAAKSTTQSQPQQGGKGSKSGQKGKK